MGRKPKSEDMPDWPALMTAQMAASYLSIDENTLGRMGEDFGLRPIEIGSGVIRWRRTDLDDLVKKLPRVEEQARSTSTPKVLFDDEQLERIIRRVISLNSTATKRALSIKEAANAAGISRSTVYRLINEGDLHPLRIGNRVLISRDELDRFLDAGASATRRNG
jgi:excisionase family DNA binding protein